MLLKLFGGRFAVSAVFPAVLGRGILAVGGGVLLRARVRSGIVVQHSAGVGHGVAQLVFHHALGILRYIGRGGRGGGGFGFHLTLLQGAQVPFVVAALGEDVIHILGGGGGRGQ